MKFRFSLFDPRVALALMVAAVMFAGCIGYPSNPAATQPVTISDPATTQPGYWFASPSHGTVVYDSFPTLYKTCENVCRDFGFKIDRVDYRTGLLTTEPLESAQIFEPWRPDVGNFKQVEKSTICSLRRTVRFDMVKNADGTFQASPKVLVERQTVSERRITSVALYRGAYSKEAPRDMPHGSKESDEGFLIPPKFWYAVGRDTPLEVKLAHEVSARLARKGREMSTTIPSSDEQQ
ncbi:MAG TPA: hypothetical protein VHS31_05290 [Tepidisphaeraceae bacterium]|jgi:hypothetical protein|nr:hypothetical protein [Tepidisphaeraceae bacterium]